MTDSDSAPRLVPASLLAAAQVEMGPQFHAQAQLVNAAGVAARVASLEETGAPAAVAGCPSRRATRSRSTSPSPGHAREHDLALRAVLVDGFTGRPLPDATAAAQAVPLNNYQHQLFSHT